MFPQGARDFRLRVLRIAVEQNRILVSHDFRTIPRPSSPLTAKVLFVANAPADPETSERLFFPQLHIPLFAFRL
jgi:hypothetical protein